MSFYANVEPCGYVLKNATTTVPERTTVEDMLVQRGIAQSASEREQALHQCPPLVRAAMAAHMQWYYLARSHSPVVRTFVHAALSSMAWMVRPALSVVHIQPGCRGAIKCARGFSGEQHRSLPYRVLHVFGCYLKQMAAYGVKADMMNTRDWPDSVRCNPPASFSMRCSRSEDGPGVVALARQDHYDHALGEGSLVRSTDSRMTAFASAVEMVFQPFLGLEFAPTTNFQASAGLSRMLYGEVLSHPRTMVEKPRSVAFKSMIPRSLAHGMEQIAEEIPYAMRWIQRCSDLTAYVRKEAKAYAALREDNAMQAMAARDNVSDWLHHYDTLSAMHWAVPWVEPKTVPMGSGKRNEPTFNHSPTLSFPGLSLPRWV